LRSRLILRLSLDFQSRLSDFLDTFCMPFLYFHGHRRFCRVSREVYSFFLPQEPYLKVSLHTARVFSNPFCIRHQFFCITGFMILGNSPLTLLSIISFLTVLKNQKSDNLTAQDKDGSNVQKRSGL